jgi:hypothetical protein
MPRGTDRSARATSAVKNGLEIADLQEFKVSDRTRTGDRLDHNQELYQLSYAHRVSCKSSGAAVRGGAASAGWRLV